MSIKSFEIDGYKMSNYMETVVMHTLNRMESGFDSCTCARCLLDIAAIALNSLPPKYNTSNEGEAFYKVQMLEQQFEIDAMTAILAAQKLVSQHPRHSEKENAD